MKVTSAEKTMAILVLCVLCAVAAAIAGGLYLFMNSNDSEVLELGNVTPQVLIVTGTPESRLSDTLTPMPTATPLPPTPTLTRLPTGTSLPPTFAPTPSLTVTPKSTNTPPPTATPKPTPIGIIQVNQWVFEVTGALAEPGRNPSRQNIVLFGNLTNMGMTEDSFIAWKEIVLVDSQGRQYEEDTFVSLDAQDRYGTDNSSTMQSQETRFVAFSYNTVAGERPAIGSQGLNLKN